MGLSTEHMEIDCRRCAGFAADAHPNAGVNDHQPKVFSTGRGKCSSPVARIVEHSLRRVLSISLIRTSAGFLLE